MDPTIWGPRGWFFIDSIILNYPDNPTQNDKNDLVAFFDILPKVLPCYTCRTNLKLHLQNNPLTDTILNDKNLLIDWIIKIHNYSRKTKLTYNDFINYYKYHYNKKDRDWSGLTVIIIIVLLIMLTFIVK